MKPDRPGKEQDMATWYRLPEREAAKTPIKHFEDGWLIRFRRLIVRCGYAHQPTDMPLEDTNTLAVERIATAFGLEQRIVERLIQSLEDPENLRQDGVFTLNPLQYPKRFFNIDRHWPLRAVYWQVRKDWLAVQSKGDESARKRTFFYIDPPQGEYFVGYVLRTVTRQVGKYYPGRPGGFSYYGDDGGEPPCVAVQVYQPLYEVRMPFQQHWTQAEPSDYFREPGHKHHVHPLDLINGGD